MALVDPVYYPDTDSRHAPAIDPSDRKRLDTDARRDSREPVVGSKRIAHPEFKDRTILEVYQEERASLMEMRGPLDGFVEKVVRATITCLIMADHNRYSVDARAAGRTVLVRTLAEHIVVLLGDEVVADHPQNFRRDQIIYDPRQYLPVLMKKPCALRNGVTSKPSQKTNGECLYLIVQRQVPRLMPERRLVHQH